MWQPPALTLGYYLAVCVLWTWVCFRHHTGDMELVLAINMPFWRKLKLHIFDGNGSVCSNLHQTPSEPDQLFPKHFFEPTTELV